MNPPPDNVLLGKGKTFALTPEAQADGFSGFVSVDGEDWGDLCMVSGNSRHCWYAAPVGSSVAIHNGHPPIEPQVVESTQEINKSWVSAPHEQEPDPSPNTNPDHGSFRSIFHETIQTVGVQSIPQPAAQWLDEKFVKPWTSPMPVPRFSGPPSPLETHAVVPEWKNRLVTAIKKLDELTKQIGAIANDETVFP